MQPWQEFIRGSRAYWRGANWLRRHPFYLALLLLPGIVALAGVIVTGVLFIDYHASLMRLFLFEPGDRWLWIALYYLAWFILHVVAFVLALILGLLISNVVAAPIYEVISVAVERDMTGRVIEISLWRSLLLIPEELKKSLLIAGFSILFFLIPGLNILAIFVAAFLMGWDNYDYPMARRGMKLEERFRHVRKDFWALMGFGFWMVIPVLSFILLPLAIAGGTILNLERMQRESGQV